ncbi:MAG: hypothetical protein HND47_16815 [Chloroflexi bacterium]|nr:hypothetical protein [Chloroflexota bacterium]
MKKVFFSLMVIMTTALTACAPSPATSESASTAAPAAVTSPTATSTPVPIAKEDTEQQSAVIVFIEGGNLQVWEEATGTSRTIFDSGDVVNLTMSDDAQVIAFLRRSVVKRSEMEWLEQSALWAVDRNGENPRELLPAEELRALLDASETDSTNIPQMEWIPGTHRLLYTAWTYYVQAEGESHATPAGLYLFDVDALTNSVLLPAVDNNLRFAPSPDGQQVALISTTGLGFINTDGSNHRPDVFPYATVSMGGQAFPSGVWTHDSRAFLLATYLEKTLETDPGLMIWSVPLNGLPAPLTDPITGSHPDSITFSPDGVSAAFFRGEGGPSGWFIVPLQPEPGPVAMQSSAYLFWQNVHWSPDGTGFAVHDRTLSRLCRDAVQDSEVCGDILTSNVRLGNIHWIDGTRFLFVTREPYDLYFGRVDGTSIRLAEGAEKFAAAAMTCQNQSGFTAGGEGPAYTSVTAGTLFQSTWRIKNTGTCTWDSSYRLAFLGGERMNGPRNLPLSETVPPGGEIELSVTLIAPVEVGTYQGQWQLFAPDGKPFGVRLPIDIVVPSYTVTDLPPDRIVAKMPSGGDLMAFGEGALWSLLSLGGNAVSRIDINTNQIAASIPVGNFPQALTIGFGSVWASASGTISRIDPQTNQVSAAIPFDPLFTLNGLATGAGSVWATNGEEGLVYRIDPNTNQVVATIEAPMWSSQIAVTEDAVWVTNPIEPILTRIDPNTNEVSATIDLECSTRWIAADAAAVWVLCEWTPAVFRIDPLTNQVAARIALNVRSRGLAFGTGGVWVTSRFDDTLTRIDPATNQIIAVYRVGRAPVSVAAAQDEILVSMNGEGTIWRIKP